MPNLSHPLESSDYLHSNGHQPPWASGSIASTPSVRLIHSPRECDDCFEYALHVEATHEEQCFQRAHQPSADYYDTLQYEQPAPLGAEGTFHEGIALGRRLQRDDDDNSFSQYRSRLERLERVEMERDELRRHRFRVEALEQELALVKDALLAAQMAHDDLAQALSNDLSSPQCPRCDSSPRLRDVPGDNEDAGAGGTLAAPSAAPIISDPVRAAPDAGEVWEDVNDFPDVKETTRLLDAHDYIENSDEDAFLLEQLQALNPHDLDEFWADYRQHHESKNGDRPPTPEEAAHDTKSPPEPRPSIPQSDHYHGELSIAQIAELIEEADADLEGDAAQVVNLLYEDAERTVKDDRTPAQVYMLLSWIPPKPQDPNDGDASIAFPTDKGKEKAAGYLNEGKLLLVPSQPLISPLSPLRQNEIFVDASPQGIGFIYGDQWLAWKFAPGHPSIPGSSPKSRNTSINGQINMSWAEIIAAELGIRTCISLGLRDCTVILRSDNGGVVQALKQGTWTERWGLDVILERVLRLCKSAGLRVLPVWVWGKMNPADAPSRGVYPPKDRMVRAVPVVPPYLHGVVSLVCS